MSTRVRITAAFLAAAAVALVIVGFVVHTALRDRLTDALDDSLDDRGTAVARLLVERGSVRPGLTEGLDDPGESFTQVVAPDGSLALSTPGLPLRPVLDPARIGDGGVDVRLDGVDVDTAEDAEEIDIDALEETGTEPFETDRARVRAARVELGGDTYTIITGATFEERDEALAELRGVLLLGGPLALLLLGLAGFAAVGRALRPLHAALARERQLVADVSHELRTPLAIISGELELAKSEDPSVQVAADEARRLSRLAEDLLLLARSDEEQLALRREPLDAAELLHATARRFASRAVVAVDAPEGLTFDGDRVRLEQALGNLVENALAYGGGDVTLLARPGVELIVRDQGPGFPAEFLPRAFERFARGREGRAGLGLAIVAVVARAHGGTAVARNHDGGAEVVLRLS